MGSNLRVNGEYKDHDERRCCHFQDPNSAITQLTNLNTS